MRKIFPGVSRVTITAFCEWVWTQLPAPRRSNAFQKSGVHADSLRSSDGRRRNTRSPSGDDGNGRTKMCEGWMRSFWTPEGAMYTLSLARVSAHAGHMHEAKSSHVTRMLMPPPVPVTQPK